MIGKLVKFKYKDSIYKGYILDKCLLRDGIHIRPSDHYLIDVKNLILYADNKEIYENPVITTIIKIECDKILSIY